MTVPSGDVRRADPQERTIFSAAAVAGVRHEPSADFLRDVGIPARPNIWFDLVEGSPEQTRTLGDAYADLHERWTDLPEGVEGRLLLGTVPYDDIAHFLHLLEKERPNHDFESEIENIDPAALDVSNSRWHDILEYVAEPEAR
ncbi:SUKH-4 family immunity protein [Streptomyces pseudovenezuelae]|uniref:SUKH-4 family immunity protein n=1 Tax=Streptomyces pseudovenezuelae TaxID=67350 RepID=UPI002E819579|nr:SUKH-4 family immunity protein [Streptomyces pseudovenezuelae]WUA88125.1 SUKH-4 family immunity protein [Streptomyces pseudovenezuelae]